MSNIKENDIVMSTRLRYARNIAGYKFPNMLSDVKKEEIIKKLENVVNKEKYNFLKMKDIDSITQRSLVEKHLISKEFAGNIYGAIITNEHMDLITMVNEEDHLRIQAIGSGLCIDECYKKLNSFTNELEEKIKFAKNDDYGYLTACPTNIGSGLRVSVMLHLYGLTKLGLANKLLEQASSIGVSVRGFYGENTEAKGCFYQISNQKTLGQSDKQIIDNIRVIISSIIEQEQKARDILLKDKILAEDNVFRAYGILKNARKISLEEAEKLLSILSFGISTGLISCIDMDKLKNLIKNIEPNTLKIITKQNFDIENEDEKRAKYIREEID